MLKHRKSKISEKLTSYISKIGRDPLNQEKKITENVNTYFHKKAKEYNIPIHSLELRIGKPFKDICIELYDTDGNYKDVVSTDELFKFFIGNSSLEIFGIKDRVITKVINIQKTSRH